MMRRLAILFLLFLLTTSRAGAHEVRPAYLEVRQTTADTFDVLWKAPARGDLRLGIYVRFDANCQTIREPTAIIADGAYIERWSIRCPEGLDGETIHIDGLQSTMTDALVRVSWLNGDAQVARATPASPSVTVSRAPGLWSVASTYFILGVEHILLGFDHLLFVLALLLLVKGWKRVIATVTAFTLAHSVTLALATLGVVNVPSRPVEAVIALSIVFVAVEIIHCAQGRTGLAARSPWVVAFLFGLLHGLGFAGALREVGLPTNAIPLALLQFNVGVEVGQLMFIGAVMLAWTTIRRTYIATPPRLALVPAYAIGVIAMYWTIERTAGLFGVGA